MTNLGLEIVFWIILLMYIGARITKNKKGYKQQYQNKLPMINKFKPSKNGYVKNNNKDKTINYAYLFFQK